MKRGILNLNKKEMNVLHEILSVSLEDHGNISQLLLNKFLVESVDFRNNSDNLDDTHSNLNDLFDNSNNSFNNSSDNKNFSIELSEEDIDLMLDILPSPVENNTEILVSIRSKLNQFLLRLRS